MIRRIRDIIISKDPPLDKQSLWIKPNDKLIHHDKAFYKFFHYVNGDWREIVNTFDLDRHFHEMIKNRIDYIERVFNEKLESMLDTIYDLTKRVEELEKRK